MPTFDGLHEEGLQLIVCRHEENARRGAFDGKSWSLSCASGPGTGNESQE